MAEAARDYSDNLDEARSRVGNPANFRVPQAADKDVKYGNDKQEGNNSERLEEARKADGRSERIKEIINDAKNISELATPMGAVSLIKQIDLIGDIPYVAAIFAALLKDLFDFGTFETVILPILFSVLCSIFIFMMMTLVGSNGKKKSTSMMIKKIGTLFGGGILDSIPGLNFFPIETATVVLIYVLVLVERKNAGK